MSMEVPVILKKVKRYPEVSSSIEDICARRGASIHVIIYQWQVSNRCRYLGCLRTKRVRSCCMAIEDREKHSGGRSSSPWTTRSTGSLFGGRRTGKPVVVQPTYLPTYLTTGQINSRSMKFTRPHHVLPWTVRFFLRMLVCDVTERRDDVHLHS